MDHTIRLNKFLSNNGLGARRKISDFLKENKVEINGRIVTEPGTRLNPLSDRVVINGRPVEKKASMVYFFLNKPKGVISSVKDEHGRRTVVDLINAKQRIYPVGRLDENTRGALILTNDGEFTNQLTHPKFHIAKTYRCIIPGPVTEKQLNQLRSGINLKEGKTAPAEAKIIDFKNNRTILNLTIHEGKNHQVKRMLSKIGLELIDLKRLSIGSLELGDLPEGEYRELNASEIKNLLR